MGVVVIVDSSSSSGAGGMEVVVPGGWRARMTDVGVVPVTGGMLKDVTGGLKRGKG